MDSYFKNKGSNQEIQGRGPRRVNSKYSNSGVNPLCPETFPKRKNYQGVKRFDNIKSREISGVIKDTQNPESRLFLEFCQRRTRPETQRYNEWSKKKQENDFKFKEVLPFGGVIKKGGNLGRQGRKDFEKRRNQDLGEVLFNPDSAWKSSKLVVGFWKNLTNRGTH